MAETPAYVPNTGRPPTIRHVTSRGKVDARLGLLHNLSGTWEGRGFNLIARPDKQGGSPLFLELNQTFEVLNFIPISSSIPNRGDLVPDIDLAGLTYLQKVTDLVTGGALHIEPGIWVNITPPAPDAPPGPPSPQNIARMGTIPHGNSLLAQGTATFVSSLPNDTFDPDAIAPANTAPFPVGSPMPVPGTLGGFPPYDLSNLNSAAVDFRTPIGLAPAGQIPDEILGVPMQELILDPCKLLTAALSGQKIQEMVVLNVSTVGNVSQLLPNPGNLTPPPQTTVLTDPNFGGSIGNIPFLQQNANAATVFATFWIETILGPNPGDDPFLQLQYVQTVLLNFPVIKPDVPPGPNLSWPHVSVATLRKTFGGQ